MANAPERTEYKLGIKATEIGWTAQVLPDGMLYPGVTINWWQGCQECQHPTKPGAIDPACAMCYAKEQLGRFPPGIPRTDPGPDGNPEKRRVFREQAERKAIRVAIRTEKRKPTDHERVKLAVVPYWASEPRYIVQRAGIERKLSALDRAALDTGYAPRVFVNSMSDIAEDNPGLTRVRRRAFLDMAEHRHIDFLVLTKRPERLASVVPWPVAQWPANVWIGATASNQDIYAARMPHLSDLAFEMDRPVTTFLSVEPMYGPIVLDAAIGLPDWIIIGSVQTSRKCKPTQIEWVEHLVGQCERLGVAVFVKQLQDPDQRDGRVKTNIKVQGRIWSQVPQLREIETMTPLTDNQPDQSHPNGADNVLEFPGGADDAPVEPTKGTGDTESKPAKKGRKKKKTTSKKKQTSKSAAEPDTSVGTPSGGRGRPKQPDVKLVSPIVNDALETVLAALAEAESDGSLQEGQTVMSFAQTRPGELDRAAEPEIAALVDRANGWKLLQKIATDRAKKATETARDAVLALEGVKCCRVPSANAAPVWMDLESTTNLVRRPEKAKEDE